MASRLTKETLDILIKNQTDLYGVLAKALNTKVTTVDMYVTRNARRLTEYPALQTISDYTGKPIQELIEEYNEEDRATVEDASIQQDSVAVS